MIHQTLTIEATKLPALINLVHHYALQGYFIHSSRIKGLLWWKKYIVTVAKSLQDFEEELKEAIENEDYMRANILHDIILRLNTQFKP